MRHAHGTRFALFAQADRTEPEPVLVSSPRGSLRAGPEDDRMYVVAPIGKPRPYGIAPLGDEPDAPPWRGERHPGADPCPDGHFDHLPPGTRAFEAAHLFGCVRFVLDVWEGYFGRPLAWHGANDHPRLELSILPTLDNAYAGYGFLELGEERREGRRAPYCLNFDVVAHEVGHALLYAKLGVPDPDAGTGEYYGMHESAADLVALVASLHFDSVLDEVLEGTRGNLYSLNALTRTAELPGNRQVRIAANDTSLADFARGWVKEHHLSMPLTGAIFDVLVDVFHEMLLERGALDPRVEALSDALLASPAYEPVVGPLIAQAYDRAPDAFREALEDARDILGTLLADGWELLDVDHLSYVEIAHALMEADHGLSGGRFAPFVAQRMDARGIGRVRVGPQLAPLGPDSHAASIRTMVPR